MKINKSALLESFIFDGLSLGFMVLDHHLVVVEWNQWLEHATGVYKENAVGKSIVELFPTLVEEKKAGHFLKCIDSGKPIFLSPLFHNYLIPIDIFIGNETIKMKQNCKMFPIKEEGQETKIFIIIEDQTDHFIHENEINRLTNILKAIRSVDKLIVETEKVEVLTNNLLKILIEEIGYVLGIVDLFGNQRLVTFLSEKPNLIADEESKDLYYKYKESKAYKELVLKAISEKEFQIASNITDYFENNEIHSHVKMVDAKSACSIPLFMNKEVVGTITLFSNDFNVFKGEEFQLLLEITNNISFALVGIEETEKRRKAEQLLSLTEKNYQTVFENTGTSTILVNENKIIEKVNKKFVEFTGYSKEEIENILEWNQFLKSDDHKFMNRLFDDKFQEYLTYEFRLITKNKESKDIILTIEKIVESNKWVISLLDITKNKEILEELREKNEEYHRLNKQYLNQNTILQQSFDKIKLINDELEVAKEKAQESDRLKSAFLANMSHEIRTPLNGILGFSELLAEDRSQELKERYIKIINNNGKQLLSLISDIIDISKIEANQIEIVPEKSSVNEEISQLYDLFSLKLQEKKGEVQLIANTPLTDLNATCIIDKMRLNQIFVNLLTNAIKFTKKGSIAFGYQIKGKFFEFYVKDTGVGISEKDQKLLFQRFSQIKSTNKEMLVSGTGLGLAISKALTELMGGTIWMESEPGVGSAFYFTIPYNKAQEDVIEIEEDEIVIVPNNINKKRILIADDDVVSNFLLESILSDEGAELLIASNGKEAVEIVMNTDGIDLILMDMRMPVMDGITATGIIKETHPNIPIIAQTAFALFGDKENALRAGCNDYLSKPIGKQDLIKLIAKHLRSD